MAPTTIQCPVGGCQFVTPEFEVTDALELLKIHSLEHSIQPVQSDAQAQGQAKPRAEKVLRP